MGYPFTGGQILRGLFRVVFWVWGLFLFRALGNGAGIFEIPEKFSRFYKLEKRHKTATVSGNTILLKITGNVIEEKKYPA